MSNNFQELLNQFQTTQRLIGTVQTTIDQDVASAVKFISDEIPVVKTAIGDIISTAEADAQKAQTALTQIGNGVQEVGDGVRRAFYIQLALLAIIIILLIIILIFLKKHDTKLNKLM